MVTPANSLVPAPASDAGDYAGEMAAHQGRLESFIRSVTGDAEAARDILQDTNVILLRKARDFRPGTNFTAWAFRIARFEIMTWRRKAGRSRLVFDDEALDRMADTAERQSDLYLSRVEALRECLTKLPERQREVPAYLLRELGVRSTGEDLERAVHHEAPPTTHEPGSARLIQRPEAAGKGVG